MKESWSTQIHRADELASAVKSGFDLTSCGLVIRALMYLFIYSSSIPF